MDKFMNIFKFLRLVDENNQMSITNIALIVVLVKITMAPAVSLTEACTLLIALGNYAHKKKLNKKG